MMDEPKLAGHGAASLARERKRLRASIEIAGIALLAQPLWVAVMVQFEPTRTDQVVLAVFSLLFNFLFLAFSLRVLNRTRPYTPEKSYRRARNAIWLLIATSSVLCMSIWFGPGRELVTSWLGRSSP